MTYFNVLRWHFVEEYNIFTHDVEEYNMFTHDIYF